MTTLSPKQALLGKTFERREKPAGHLERRIRDILVSYVQADVLRIIERRDGRTIQFPPRLNDRLGYKIEPFDLHFGFAVVEGSNSYATFSKSPSIVSARQSRGRLILKCSHFQLGLFMRVSRQ
jgi:hypothetical protein